MTAMEYLINHPEIKHGTIRVAFGPDEEIGVVPTNLMSLNLTWIFYTMDGGPVGELQFETFNAAQAKLQFKGKTFIQEQQKYND